MTSGHRTEKLFSMGFETLACRAWSFQFSSPSQVVSFSFCGHLVFSFYKDKKWFGEIFIFASVYSFVLLAHLFKKETAILHYKR